ncbi:MAG: GerMN domain-containing protein [Deltaproteobacteria bacterium]|nr:GerMN domain-containing protein [Deltaproteobacteria bacterium]MBN2845900.1 GerMN domain-containing protein [Deltaproteobacteria bacterium]
MATKKQRKAKALKEKKRRQNLKLFILSLIVLVGVGFLVFLFISLFEYIYPPTTGEGERVKKEKYKVELYFSDSNERFLVPEDRYIWKEKKMEDQIKELVTTLIGGSTTGLVGTFPEGTKVKDVTIKDGSASISFNRTLVDLHPGGSASEMMTIYSLTNTITRNMPQVKSVKILVEGKEIETIKGHIDTRNPFTANMELIVRTSK